MRTLAVLVIALFALGIGGAASGHGSAGAAFAGGYAPVWSPDGGQIAYVGPLPDALAHPPVVGFTQVFAVSADGSGGSRVVATEPRQEVRGGSHLEEVRWAAGGRFVYQTDNYTLYSSAGHGTKRLGLIGSIGGDAFSLSHDGREVAFTAPCGCNVQQGTEVRFVPAAGGVARVLPHPRGTLDSYPSFSPDGAKVAFARVFVDKKGVLPFANEFIEVESVHGGSARSLGVNGYDPVFSPDGRWIAFTGRTGIEVVAATGGHARTLVPARCCSFGAAYSWSPDSHTLADTGSIGAGTVSLSGSKAVFHLPGLRPDSHTPQWSPDGKTVAFSANSNGHDLDGLDERVYVIDADGSGLRRLA